MATEVTMFVNCGAAECEVWIDGHDFHGQKAHVFFPALMPVIDEVWSRQEDNGMTIGRIALLGVPQMTERLADKLRLKYHCVLTIVNGKDGGSDDSVSA